MFGCNEKEENSSLFETEKNKQMDESLVVYISGTMHSFITDDMQYTLYPTKNFIGPRMLGGEFDCYNGNAIAQAVLDYSEECGVPVEIHFIEDYQGDGDPLKDLYIGNKLPDLMIVGKHSRYDYSVLASQGILLDFSSHVYGDQNLLDEEKYYTEIIEGAEIDSKVVGLPILFNMNGMITSEKNLRAIEVGIGREASYEEILHVLKKSCEAAKNEMGIEAIYETSGNLVAGRYIPSILLSAAYPNYWDKQSNEIVIQQGTLAQILEVMQIFNQQEFVVQSEWTNKTYFENINSQGKWFSVQGNDLTPYESISVFLSGGGNGGTNVFNSLLTDAMYFQSVYENMGDTLVLRGIPSIYAENEFSANISLVLLGFSTSEKTDEIYELGKYLVDYEFPMSYGFSVNKELTQLQLENVQSTEITLYPDLAWSTVTAGDIDMDEIMEQAEVLKPLRAEYVEIIQYMLDNIAGAGLPSKTIEYSLLASVQNAVGDGQMNPEESSVWMMDQLNRFEDMQNEIEPFVDQDFDRSIYIGIH